MTVRKGIFGGESFFLGSVTGRWQNRFLNGIDDRLEKRLSLNPQFIGVTMGRKTLSERYKMFSMQNRVRLLQEEISGLMFNGQTIDSLVTSKLYRFVMTFTFQSAPVKNACPGESG
jgi:hypothetical protein